MTIVLDIMGWLVAVFCALSLGRWLAVVVAGRRQLDRRGPQQAPARCAAVVAIVVPAFNEAAGIAASVRSLAASAHPVAEIIVVDDGSTDATAAIVLGLGLPGVRLLRQANAGKAMALNAAIACCTAEIVVTVDADTRFDAATLGYLVAPFVDERVGAVAGNTKVDNADSLVGRWQHLEYVSGFNADRRVYEMLGFMPTVPGAVGAFRRVALDQVGWLSNDTVAEDTDLTIAISRARWRVVYEDRAVAWTEVPATMRTLWRQRIRWTYGTLQSMWKHRGAWRSTATVARSGLWYMVANIVVLPLLAPLIDVLALSGLIVGDPAPIGLWGALGLIQFAVAAFTLRLDGESLRGLWTLPLQQPVFRVLAALVVARSFAATAVRRPVRWHANQPRRPPR